jgi:hypothetical protein
MECTFAALIACFSLYLDTGISYTDVEYAEVRLQGSEMIYVSQSHNPYGQLGIGIEARLSERVVASLGAMHDSSLRTNSDRGENVFRLNVRWYLLGHRR